MDDSLTLEIAAALGALQGLTEFLPVSSSGHVSLGAWLFGVPDMPLTMLVVVHGGTLLATLMVFGGDVGRLTRDSLAGFTRPKEFLNSDQGRIVVGVLVASIPTAILGLALEERVERWAQSPWVVGLCLLGSAAAVLTTRQGGGTGSVLLPSRYVLIGVAQGIAVLPGVSRSGITIAVGMFLGLRAHEAFRFSFLLSLPAVAGALVLKLAEPGAAAALGTPTLLAGAVAWVTGYAALRALRHVVMQGKLWAFSFYLIPVGLGVMTWDILGH